MSAKPRANEYPRITFTLPRELQVQIKEAVREADEKSEGRVGVSDWIRDACIQKIQSQEAKTSPPSRSRSKPSSPPPSSV